MSTAPSQRFPLLRRILGAAIRLGLVALIVVGVGYGVGLAAGSLANELPVSKGAPSLDHFVLVGSLDPNVANIADGDLPKGWQAGGPAYPIVGAPLCGRAVEAVGADSSRDAAKSWVNVADNASIANEVVEFGSASQASTYVSKAGRALNNCKTFYIVNGAEKERFEASPVGWSAPVSDYTARVVQPENRSSYVVVTMFQAGKYVVGLTYRGPVRPDRDLLSDLELKILGRIDPTTFAPTTSSIPGSKDLPDKSVVSIDPASISTVPSADDAGVPNATLPPAATNPPPSSVPPSETTPVTTGRSSTGG